MKKDEVMKKDFSATKSLTKLLLGYVLSKRRRPAFAALLSLLVLMLYLARTMPFSLLFEAGDPDDEVFFLRPNATAHIDCGRVLAADNSYISALTSAPRVTHSESEELEELAMDCSSILARHYFPPHPLSPIEAQWPWAHARVVYRDYAMLEAELAAGYAPQNWYCYAVDTKADARFRQRMSALSNCFPNVFLSAEEVEVDGYGRGYFPAIMNCLGELIAPEREWKYVALLQNHDIQIRTNAEAVRILQWLDGANDVEMYAPPTGRYNPDLDWSFSALRIFRNHSRNSLHSANGNHPPHLPVTKGYSTASVTRAMAEFMVRELDLTEFFHRQEDLGLGADEEYIATLNAADALEAPGGFTHTCIERGVGHDFITRLVLWGGHPECRSEIWRRNVCVFAMEDLWWLATRTKELFANKLMPEIDAGALACWHEWMFNQTRLQVAKRGRSGEEAFARVESWRPFYARMAQVRFQEFKRRNGSSAKALESFQCELSH